MISNFLPLNMIVYWTSIPFILNDSSPNLTLTFAFVSVILTVYSQSHMQFTRKCSGIFYYKVPPLHGI
jgi:hypothetical protein